MLGIIDTGDDVSIITVKNYNICIPKAFWVHKGGLRNESLKIAMLSYFLVVGHGKSSAPPDVPRNKHHLTHIHFPSAISYLFYKGSPYLGAVHCINVKLCWS